MVTDILKTVLEKVRMACLCSYYTGQTWLDVARDCRYICPEICEKFNMEYDHFIGMLVNMIVAPEKWSF